ncbi:uncharacterized protein L199_001764 [Kwoniella botswanensis]|uniref:uncharacterized protein n=1 Tax=Kwoniella botswanensis TaxID=1268659 RepID=UPI00315D5D0E
MIHSPPLPLTCLPPPLSDSDSWRRPASIVSDFSKSSTLTRNNPPPSSYNRRSQSLEILKTISVLAPAYEGYHQLKKTNNSVHDAVARTAMSNMATGLQSQPKKPGFFRRMSLSTAQNKPTVQPSINDNGLRVGPKGYGRSVSGPGPSYRQDIVAGPSYESLPAGAAPSAFRRRDDLDSNMDQRRRTPADQTPNSQSQPKPNKPNPTPIASAFTSPPAADSQSPPAATPRSRYPIHPALASPPTSTPRRLSATSPYDPINPPVVSAASQGGQRYDDVASTTKQLPANHSVNLHGKSTEQLHSQSTSHHRQGHSSSPHTPRHVQADHVTAVLSSKPQSPLHGSERTLMAPDATHQNGTTRSTAKRHDTARFSRFDDADIPNSGTLPVGAQATVYAHDKQSEIKPMVSARRSASSSRRTPMPKVEKNSGSSTRQGNSSKQDNTAIALETPTLADKTISPRPPNSEAKAQEQLSEAGAYAKAIAATISNHRAVETPRETTGKPTVTATPPKARATRPLPTPPTLNSRNSSKANVVVIASSSKLQQTSPKHSLKRETSTEKGDRHLATPTSPNLVKNDKRSSVRPLNFDFPRSPTLPPLIDPRTTQDKKLDPISQWSRDTPSPVSPNGQAPLATSQLPPRLSSAQSRRAVSSPLASPTNEVRKDFGVSHIASPTIAPSPPTQVRPQMIARERPRATLTFLLLHAPIQAALLAHMSINSFLSLTGASDLIRKRFTGEAIGRWVLGEWGVQVDREKGRSWPNLTVWEGFLESLLHDPITYSTYPAQWYNLLQHLCLSHTLIVLHLRQLPLTAFPNPPPLSFEDDFVNPTPNMANLPFSSSFNSFGSQRPRSRLGSAAGSDAGSLAPATKMPRQERLVEIVMPEPLAAQGPQDDEPTSFPTTQKVRRRGSIGSIASAASFSFGRRRTASISAEPRAEISPNAPAAPMPSGKAALPPVSYPSAKRYGFKRHGEPSRSRKSSESSRPGSIFSVQSTPSFSAHQRVSSVYSGRPSFAVDRNAPPVPGFPAGLSMPPPIGGGGTRSSFASSDGGRSGRRSENGGNSPISGVFLSRRDFGTPPPNRPEPCFDRPIPFTVGRAPILRVFVPLSDRIQRWPSAEGAAAATKELEKCGALRRMKLGDIVVNTAIRQPKTTEHVLVYVPFVRHLLVPLDYTFSPNGNLPSYVNGFDIAPSYYYPFLPTPQVIFLNLAPFAERAMKSIRLAYDRRDVTVASGARLSAKRYLHVAGFEVHQADPVAPEWYGMVSLEAEGTAEGKQDIEARLVGLNGSRPVMGPWELVREKSMMGTIWLRLIK